MPCRSTGPVDRAHHPVARSRGLELTPAVPIRKSITDAHIVCLEDGKKLKMLKRHLMTAYGMTPKDYRAKWGLKVDYPMVAPAYARKRQELAKRIGLGRKPRAVALDTAPAPQGPALSHEGGSLRLYGWLAGLSAGR